ncbi:MAG: SGNH/GDSL hydrolase family protein [Opitutales bacterium]|jgi:lysophospholipase L1-like esterase|nr:SGNH/GDSL hydrolase family protein [Opitutales bacterium]MDP4658213.1 SGNH/GDSL hydrolase family protein [Opitutales bacterium]MDP4775577.1 SGNH/GDSL hydrolase family protein [Opitutales bacterium]MDP4786917.1 SGNH/GDSL hydrolase family protein [Opitutales bacterium]MDP4860360.1 SGNH/GDSL hydrolase family protein [Opitutales bacterium]
MRYPCAFLLLCLGLVGCQQTQPRPDIVPPEYVGRLAPKTPAPLLQKGDRLAICGDSITEQKMYSLLMEAYIVAARSDLHVTVRQYGWSGEQAGGFLRRMDNDVLRFKPTIATTCYGMNDFRYVPKDDAIAATYRANQTAVVRKFKEAGVRVVLGSSGTIHSVPPWVKTAKGTWQELNLALLDFRNIGIEVAQAEQVAFADVYWPMLVKGHQARAKYGEGFKLEGNDGVHPGWAGHVVMATAFLEGLGLRGDVGQIDVDLATGQANARYGQRIMKAEGGVVSLRSFRIPASFEPGDVTKDGTIAAGVALADFQKKLNRLTLRVAGAKTAQVKVTWGDVAKIFTAAELAKGVNLAAEFPQNPTSPAFAKIWKAVAEKQAYETKQIKTLFRSKEAKADMEAVVKSSQVEFDRLAAALQATLKPVDSTLKVEAVR